MAAYWRDAGIVGVDFDILRDAAERWLSGSGFYRPYQVAGPYVHSEHEQRPAPAAGTSFRAVTGTFDGAVLPSYREAQVPTILEAMAPSRSVAASS